MPLDGSNKAEYQKEYMRKRRSNKEGLTEEGSNNTGSNKYPPNPLGIHPWCGEPACFNKFGHVTGYVFTPNTWKLEYPKEWPEGVSVNLSR